MELQKVFQEVNRKLAYNTQHLSKKSSNVFGIFLVLLIGWLGLGFLGVGGGGRGILLFVFVGFICVVVWLLVFFYSFKVFIVYVRV